tara:strand:- start:180 stop:401 length:222 start_codon:yes stop_codon:yes gene_type:complete
MKLQGATTFLEKRAKFYNKTLPETLHHIYVERFKKGLATSKELEAVEAFYMGLGMTWESKGGYWRTMRDKRDY